MRRCELCHHREDTVLIGVDEIVIARNLDKSLPGDDRCSVVDARNGRVVDFQSGRGAADRQAIGTSALRGDGEIARIAATHDQQAIRAQ